MIDDEAVRRMLKAAMTAASEKYTVSGRRKARPPKPVTLSTGQWKEDGMEYEYKVVEERFGSPKETEECLNDMAKEGWEHYEISTLGPIPSRWLYFRREKQ